MCVCVCAFDMVGTHFWLAQKFWFLALTSLLDQDDEIEDDEAEEIMRLYIKNVINGQNLEKLD